MGLLFLTLLYHAEGDVVPTGHLPASKLHWAFAGTSSSTPLVGDAQGGSHSVWRHWVDSRCAQQPEEQEPDEGDMYPLDTRRTLEKGCTVDPATGLESGHYEEVWLDVDVELPDGGGRRCGVVLQTQHDEKQTTRRGMIVRLGRFCQGVLRDGADEGHFTAERWEWVEGRQHERARGQDHEGRWTMTMKIGDGQLPCRAAMEGADELHVGGEVKEGDTVWEIVEVS